MYVAGLRCLVRSGGECDSYIHTLGCFSVMVAILGDPGAVSGGRKKSKQARKNSGEEKPRTRIRAPICQNKPVGTSVE